MSQRLTKEALKLGTAKVLKLISGLAMTVTAPGGKLITICNTHITMASRKSTGVAWKAAGRSKVKGFDLMSKSSSMVDTFMLFTLRRCQRYWTKASERHALSAYPNTFDRTFDMVDTYDWGITSPEPSASFPFMY